MLTLISWNVNGIRAAVKNGFKNLLKQANPDILALQEVKINDDAREKEKFDFANYEEVWNSAQKPGYSGTAILIKEKIKLSIINKANGIGIDKFDIEGRVQTLEFKTFYFINAYFPHSRHDLSRLDFKLEFDEAILNYLKKLQRKKPIIITGDFNVAHKEIDLANPETNEENSGFLPEERAGMNKLLAAGFVDAFRYLYPQKIQYTWWSYKFKARERDIGWRIDYFLVSNKLKSKIKNTVILNETMGSDHCPILLNIDT